MILNIIHEKVKKDIAMLMRRTTNFLYLLTGVLLAISLGISFYKYNHPETYEYETQFKDGVIIEKFIQPISKEGKQYENN